MRKHLSIFMLAVRFTIYKVIGLLAVMSAVQVALFLAVMNRHPQEALGTLIMNSCLKWTAMAGFVVLCILLCSRGKGSGKVKSVYTLRRLSVSELTVTGWWALQSSLMFLAFWLWEALTGLGLCLIYANRAPAEMIGPQTIFLIWYEVDFLHKLIPLADISGWIRNGVLVLGLGVCSAVFSHQERHGNRSIWIWLMAMVTMVGFSRMLEQETASDIRIIWWGLMIAGAAAAVLIRRELHPKEEGK